MSEPTSNRIRQLVQMPYQDYLQTPEWKAKRDEAVARDAGRCRLCYSSKDLQVHHRTYHRRGQEDLNDLTTLCRECHEAFHQRVTERELLAQWGESYVPLTEEEKEQKRERQQEDWECYLLGSLLLAPEEYRKTNITQIVDPEDFTDLSRQEIYRLLADSHPDSPIRWLPVHLHTEAMQCMAFVQEKTGGDLKFVASEIVNSGCRIKINILREKNRGLEDEMSLATEAGDKSKERILRQEIARLLRQIREIDAVMRLPRPQDAVGKEIPEPWEIRLTEIQKRQTGQ